MVLGLFSSENEFLKNFTKFLRAKYSIFCQKKIFWTDTLYCRISHFLNFKLDDFNINKKELDHI